MTASTRGFLARMRREVRRGFLPLWIMEELATGPAYGYELLERLGRQFGPDLRVTPSTLYPTLARLRVAGLVRSFQGTVSSGPLRKYYELTEAGRANLAALRSIWGEMTSWAPPAQRPAPDRRGSDG